MASYKMLKINLTEGEIKQIQRHARTLGFKSLSAYLRFKFNCDELPRKKRSEI